MNGCDMVSWVNNISLFWWVSYGLVEDIDPELNFITEEYKSNVLQKIKIKTNSASISQLKQIHSNSCVYVNKESIFDIQADAQWTDCFGLLLTVGVADCIPIIFYTVIGRKIIWTIHSGWRWTLHNIIWSTLAQLKENDIDIQNVNFWIWPCICKNCFEFGRDWSDPCELGFPKKYIKYNTLQKIWNIDTRKMLMDQLFDNGITVDQISCDERCTVEENQLVSRRRDGILWKNNYVGSK